ncbi:MULTISPECIES: hypothetical protein [Methanobacterium]|jgi:rubredoxin|uniref:DNA helicase PriA n=1 Tax=Methanobacterium formicicum TaxID=2162 RepID=A0A090I541_METFO|nr:MULTISPECIES: hypothetical protein [Methanobacterium]CDG64686.1 hypothetical protein MBMB1_0579 [Methanobacterium sp. MB1]KUK75625.1 MAG: Uncharacterized protein XD90_0115 [Methanobacterium sp. 42_16]MBF4474100.1 DNA helicase PriA [Methanobacterium formicicum]MDG3546378.1 DNA helicase PriA [Methanobacterium formicicum]MDH2659672.1 DNA helicase PriA [Methanobacterium formicicum]
MKCKICGHVFDESEKSSACQGCLINNCNMIRCPNCGFEQLPESKTESKLVKFISALFKHSNNEN